MADRRNKVVKFHNVPAVNIGVIIFILVFIFLGVQIIRSLRKERVSVYEVQKSYMDTNITGTAIALREEALITTDTSGYVNYYIRDGQKVGKNATVYTLDSTGTLSDLIAEASIDSSTISGLGYAEIQQSIVSFQNYFTDVHFSDVYEFKYDLESQVLDIASTQVLEELTGSGDAASGFVQKTSDQSGVITFYQDGYETKQPLDITGADFNTAAYERTALKTGEIIQAGSPVYKLITSENWHLILPLSPEDAQRLENDTRATLNLPNISHVVYSDIEVLENNGEYFANITLDKLMVNYCNERFLPVEIVMTREDGYSIPNSAIVEKQVLKIPSAYLTTGSNSSEAVYFNVRTLDEAGNLSVRQVAPEIYGSDDSFYYVDPNAFEEDAILVMNDSEQTVGISDLGRLTLTGVYSANRGTAEFQPIEILAEDNEFTIISENGYISLYDRIVLNASAVEEGQMIY